MGTCGLLGFIILALRHAAYNHWDSYPDGLGKEIVKFILSLTPEDYATMARLVAEITWVDSKSKPSPELQERHQKLGFADTNVSDQNLEEWYCLLHKTQGAAALPAIQSGELKHMEESIDFFNDGDPEWSYFIDFENRMLETWEDENLLNIVSFEMLVKDGVEGYLGRLEGEEDEEDEDEDEEDEEDEESEEEEA